MIKNCTICLSEFNSLRKQIRCDECRFVTVSCLSCDSCFKTLFRKHRTKKFCSVKCGTKFSSKTRFNPTRSEQACENMSLAMKKAYASGTKKSWNRKSNAELSEIKKLRYRVGGPLYRLVRSIDTDKQHRVSRQLGYSAIQLKIRLESLWKEGMNWYNYGKHIGEWNIDHIIPVSSFSLQNTVAEINRLDNLQPLWATENASKGGVTE